MRRLAVTALALGALSVGLMLSLGSGDDEAHRLRVALADAAGLRQGEPVVIGGVRVGKIKSLDIVQPGDRVIADLRIEDSHWPVGKDVSAAIAPVNLLGQKELDLNVGNRADPAPDGHLVPATRVTPSTDLDQVLDVLDPGTRARLAVFLNEAGRAFIGRRADLSTFLQELPPGLVKTTQLLDRLVSDNRTLSALLQSSGEFIGDVNRRRSGVTRMVREVGQAASAVASRRRELLQTLDRAPGALVTLRRFLAQLQAATVPIRPAARAVSEAARPLTQTLAQVEPFRRAAQPALGTATRVAPDLTRLATRATPVFGKARKPVDALAEFSTKPLPRIGSVLDGSIDNIVAIVANWAHAIQLRDGLSHIFRGEVAYTAEAIRSAVSRVLAMSRSPSLRRKLGLDLPTKARRERPTDSSRSTAPKRPGPDLRGVLPKAVDDARKTLSKILPGGSSAAPPRGGGSGAERPSTGLLDFLLGR